MTKISKSRILKIIIENDIDLHIFGNGWDMHPWFKKYANGSIKNGNELNQLYNASKINLNPAPGMLFHPKFCEVTGGGNFCLTLDYGKNDCLPMINYFHDSSLITWSNEENLAERLRHFLKNSEEREQMAHFLQDEVLNKFSSKQAAERIFKELSENI